MAANCTKKYYEIYKDTMEVDDSNLWYEESTLMFVVESKEIAEDFCKKEENCTYKEVVCGTEELETKGTKGDAKMGEDNRYCLYKDVNSKNENDYIVYLHLSYLIGKDSDKDIYNIEKELIEKGNALPNLRKADRRGSGIRHLRRMQRGHQVG